METRRGLPGDPDDTHSRYIEAAVEGVLISCLYMPNGNPAPGPKFDYKLRWFDRLATHAAELLATGMPVVLGLLAQGWTDAVRALHPGERIYSFWDYFRNAWARNAGLRIDHLLLSPSIVDRLRAAEVDRQVRGWEKASDHAPAWIELADAGESRVRLRGTPTTGFGRGGG